ncbi:MAG: phosphoribosyltransferase [Anaerolinea sp.]|nr:phosphoribosyltransferase [Anaerolinea sp.]
MSSPHFPQFPQDAPPRKEVLSWSDVDRLIHELLPQFRGAYDALLMITRGGIVPGGILSEALDIKYILTAAVEFHTGVQKRLAWPTFLQFPGDSLLRGRRILVVDDVWDSGRTIMTVKSRIEAAGASPELCVLHYKPAESMFRDASPDYYAAVTDAWIVYPWEIERGIDRQLLMARVS